MPDPKNAVVELHVKINNQQTSPGVLKQKLESAVTSIPLEPNETVEVLNYLATEAA